MSEYQATPAHEQAEFDAWFKSKQGDAYDSMYLFARDAWQAARAIDAQRIAELEAQVATLRSVIAASGIHPEIMTE